jgi:hypothetical protein
MKPPVRRLGRGLGAFLDFGPAGEDGTAFVADALTARGASVLETSAPATPVPRPEPRPAPVAVAARPSIVAPPAPPPPDDRPFVDDVVLCLTFPEVDLE